MTEENCLNQDLEQELFAILKIDAPKNEDQADFACRPMRATSTEKHTAYGRFAGRIGIADLGDFGAAMRDLTTGHTMRVILDFSETQLSKSAIGELIAFAASMFGRNRRLYLYKLPSHLRKQLADMALLGFFTRLESEEDIIAIFEA